MFHTKNRETIILILIMIIIIIIKTALQELHDKHPPPAPVARRALADLVAAVAANELPEPEGWEVTAEDVADAARTLEGSAGITGNDAATWRTMLTKYGIRSHALRKAIARLATMLGSQHVEWKKIEGLRVCKLIALGYKEEEGYKVRPLGIGEVLARLISQLALRKTRAELVDAIGPDNLVVGMAGGCEGAVKAAADLLKELSGARVESEGLHYDYNTMPAMLMLDASNVFNR